MRKLKPALVRGRPASFWRIADDCLVHHHPRGTDFTEVPIAHLIDEAMLAEHVSRLEGKNWVRRPAIDELLSIADGAAS